MTRRVPAEGEPEQVEPSGLYGPSLARTHHSHFGDLARGAATSLLDLLARRGLASGTIVELACGGGVSTRILSDAGYALVGVDLSESMIELARHHAPRARFAHASLWDFDLPQAVAVTAIGEAFCYHSSGEHPDQGMLEGRFRRIFDALTSGGILLFDVATARRRGPGSPRRAAWEASGTRISVEEREDADSRTLIRTIDSFAPVEGVHRHDREIHRLTLYELEAVEASLRLAGFESHRTTRSGDVELPPGCAGFVATKP